MDDTVPERAGQGELHQDRSYFDRMYADTLDPWDFETSWYERRKFAITVAALPASRYRRCLVPGCSTGTLNEMLSTRCDEVIAYDFIPSVVHAASARFRGRRGVKVVEAEFPTFIPDGTGDLVIWSEVAYYLTDDGFDVAVSNVGRWLEPDGHLVAVHYTGATDYQRTGHDVASVLDGVPFLRRVTTLIDDRFELGVWQRVSRDLDG